MRHDSRGPWCFAGAHFAGVDATDGPLRRVEAHTGTRARRGYPLFPTGRELLSKLAG
jgi:hypothetical protein